MIAMQVAVRGDFENAGTIALTILIALIIVFTGQPPRWCQSFRAVMCRQRNGEVMVVRRFV